MNQVRSVILAFILMLSYSAQAQERIQTATVNSGASNVNQLSASISKPSAENTLIAVVSTRTGNLNSILSVQQTDVVWTRATSASNASGPTIEIWYTTSIGANAGTTVTFNIDGYYFTAAAITEYSGLLTPDAKDQTATATGSTNTGSTGTTSTTSQAAELWIGGIGLGLTRNSSYTYGAPSNSFVQIALSNSTRNNNSFNAYLHVLERWSITTGNASSGITFTNPDGVIWAGAIATFKRQATITSFSPSSICTGTQSYVTINGTGFKDATQVSFNGNAAESFTINSTGTQITAKLSAETGTGKVGVTIPGFTALSTTNITINPTTWTGALDSQWNKAENWCGGIPTTAYDVRIPNLSNKPLVKSRYSAGARTLKIEIGTTVTIAPHGTLEVAGTIRNFAGTTGLIIQSAKDSVNGSLIFLNPVDSPVLATIQMYSKATALNTNPASNYQWQFFGIPLRSLDNPLNTFTNSYVRQYDPAGKTFWNVAQTVWGAKWDPIDNASTLTSFTGYEITQDTSKIITFQGELENRDYNKSGESFQQLTYYPDGAYPGQYIFGNSYSAAIRIADLHFGDGMEKTVYLYNTGSFSDWQAGGYGTVPGQAPGQYIAIPQNIAASTDPEGIPREIPSMQGFTVRIENQGPTATFGIPYSAVIKPNTVAQRVHSPNKENPLNVPSLLIDVHGKQFTDRVWLFTHSECSNWFDNGWDGEKFSATTDGPQLYTLGTDREYQVHTTNSIHKTYLGFRKGTESSYTLHFRQQGTLNTYPEGIYLHDLVTGTYTNVSIDGATYRFNALASDPIRRFRILTRPETEDDSNDGGVLVHARENQLIISNYNSSRLIYSIYDMRGARVYNADIQAGEKQGITNAEGVYVIKFSNGSYRKASITRN